MADKETELEWEKSKRIEAERMKAVKDLEEQKPDKISLAYLDPKMTKVKGWSKDPDVMLASIERMSNWAVVLVVGGAVLSVIGMFGGIVAETSNLGLGGVLVSGLPSGVGMLLMGIGAIMSLVVIGFQLYARFRLGRKLDTSFWTAIGALAFNILFFIARIVLMAYR